VRGADEEGDRSAVVEVERRLLPTKLSFASLLPLPLSIKEFGIEMSTSIVEFCEFEVEVGVRSVEEKSASSGTDKVEKDAVRFSMEVEEVGVEGVEVVVVVEEEELSIEEDRYLGGGVFFYLQSVTNVICLSHRHPI